jgi:PAS domain S-box-containing protein
MEERNKKKEQLIHELAAMRQRLDDMEKLERDHKRAEEALRESEQRFRSLVETTSDWVWETDRNGFYTYSSPKIKDLLGYEAEEIIGMTPFDLMPEGEAERVAGLFRSTVESRKPISGLENTNRHKDGRRVVLETSAVPIFDAEGNLLGYRGIDRDITERRRAEESRRESEERLKTIFHSVRAGILIIDAESHVITDANPVAAEMIGVSKDQIVGSLCHRYVCPAEKGQCPVTDLGQRVNNAEKVLLRVDGEKVPIIKIVNIVRIGGRDHLVESFVDITEHKRAEEALEKSLSLLRATLECTDDGILVVDREGKVASFNHKFLSQWRIPDFLATSNDDDQLLKYVLDQLQDPEIFLSKVKILYAQPNLESNDILKFKDGRIFERYSKPQVVGKEIIGRVWSFRDVTERKRAEEALRKSEETARRFGDENRVVAEIGRIISSTPNIEEVYKLFSEKVKGLLPYDRLVINLIHKDGGSLMNRYVEGESAPGRNWGEVFPMAGTLTEQVMKNRRGTMFSSQDEREIAVKYPGLVPEMKAGSRSFLSVPLISGDRPIGGLHFRSNQYRAYTEKDLRLAENIAAQIAGAIANAKFVSDLKISEGALKKSEESAKELAQENATMADIARILYSTLDIQAVYERLVEEVRKVIPFDRIAIGIIRSDDQTLALSYVAGDEVAHRRKGDVFPLRGTIAEEVVRTRSSQCIREENLDEFVNAFPGLLPLVHCGIRAMLFVPLIAKDQVTGMLTLQLAKGRSYAVSDLRIAEKLGILIGGAITNAQLFAGRQRAENALRVSEEKYRLLVQNANDAIFILKDGTIKFSNIKTEKMFGYSAGELSTIPFLNHIHPTDREKGSEGNPESSESAEFARPQSFRIRNKSGQEIWVELKRVDIEWEGKPATLNFASDITDQKKLEVQFLQAQKMEAVGRLAGGVAHDFNNLLTIINSNSQLALMELKEWDPLREKFESIQKAGERAAGLTRQLLALSRRHIVQMKVIDLNAILRDLEKMLHRVLGEDIELTTILDENLGRVKADPGQMEQAVLNLVINARDAMPSGGKLTIETGNVNVDQEHHSTHKGMKAGRYVSLAVSDTGIGMKPEIQERIFEPFFTTKAKDKGTGLGLSTVYGVIKQSGGDIWVYSEPGRGTTFKIYLPQIEEPLEEARQKVPHGKRSRGQETILVVEDEDEVRKLAVEVLRRYGYTVWEASRGEDALRVYAEGKEPLQLLLSDIVMPGMSGPDFARRLKHAYPEIKVLFMSGYTDNTLFQNGLLDQGMFFLPKPFSVEGLTGKVRTVLDT